MKRVICFGGSGSLGTAQVALPSLDDTKETIAKQWRFRMIIDEDNQTWSRLDWEAQSKQ